MHNCVKSVPVGSYIKYNPVNMKLNVQWSVKGCFKLLRQTSSLILLSHLIWCNNVCSATVLKIENLCETSKAKVKAKKQDCVLS